MIDWLKELEVAATSRQAPLPELPGPGSEQSFSGISKFLIDRGLDRRAVDQLMAQINEMEEMVSWYHSAQVNVSVSCTHVATSQTKGHDACSRIRLLGSVSHSTYHAL